jgi:hypothetical protein
MRLSTTLASAIMTLFAVASISETARAEPVIGAQTYSPMLDAAAVYQVMNGYAQSFTVTVTGSLVSVAPEVVWNGTATSRTFVWELRDTGPSGLLRASGSWVLGASDGAGSGLFALPFAAFDVTSGQVLFLSIRQVENSAVGESTLFWNVGEGDDIAPYADGVGFRRTFSPPYSPNLGTGVAFDLRVVAMVEAPCDPSGASPQFSPGFGVNPIEVEYGATTLTVTGQIASEDPIAFVAADGLPGGDTILGTVGPTGSFTLTFPVDPTMTTVTVIAEDTCGRQATRRIDLAFASICDLPLYDECIAPGTGSVFYVELIDAELRDCLLTCTIDAVGAAPVCDTENITCSN